MGGLVCILAMIMALEGQALVKHDFVINGRMGFARVRAGLILFLVFLCIFVFAISMFTIALTAKPHAPALFTMMFGVTTFFFGAIPLIAEGDSILALSRVHNTTLDLMCDLNPRQLREKTNKYTYAMFEMAHHMDDTTQFLLDNYMCTKTCPCRDFNQTHPSVEYAWLPEETLNLHNRTNENKPGYLPLLWVNDTHKIGFSSFMECYNYWEDLADQGMVDLREVFDTSNIILYGQGDFFKGPDYSDRFRKGRAPNNRLKRDPSGLYLMWHEQDMEVYQIFEDDFNCSGWCRQGIFYFQNPTHMGPPKDTCFKHLK